MCVLLSLMVVVFPGFSPAFYCNGLLFKFIERKRNDEKGEMRRERKMGRGD